MKKFNFQEALKIGLAQEYRRLHSEAIKRGLARKKLMKVNEKSNI